MAGLAQITGRDMRHRFTPGVDIIMTGIAADAGHLGTAVIDDRVGKSRRVMAGNTVLGGRDMVVGFIGTDHPVVAGGTGIHIQITGRMVESARSECARSMAGGAVLGGCQVSQRWSRFPGGNKAIVASRTAVLIEVSRSMIEGTRGEATRHMTDHTVLNCCQMAHSR